MKEISPGCSLEGMMLKLKLQYFGHLMWRVDSLEKTLMLGGMGTGGEGDDRGWDGWMASLTWWTWVWVNSWSWCWTGRPGVLRFMGSQRVGHDWATELNWILPKSSFSARQETDLGELRRDNRGRWGQAGAHFVVESYCFIFPCFRRSQTSKLFMFLFPALLTVLWCRSFLFVFLWSSFAGFLRLTLLTSPVPSSLPPIAESPALANLKARSLFLGDLEESN